ncbi:hypothetical protein CTI12_AA278720 [Artemisia annua]|uniref:Uncharacterized protein n=1 Tax=Artemisia annua TaxID=35608 RepID=A0A2U1NC87_ARTAN|nr:hypothetical protein CTI12_AA278720 [Artemisia annua]
MATIPNIPTLFSSPKPCSLQSAKKSLNLRPNHVKSSFSSSRSCSLTIKCRQPIKGSNGDTMSVWEGLLAGMIYEHLDPFDLVSFTEGVVKAREKVDVAERQFEQQELEIKKMKEYIDQLENSAVQLVEEDTLPLLVVIVTTVRFIVPTAKFDGQEVQK